MATLADSLKADLSGYGPPKPERPPALAQMLNDNKPKANSFRRCPLPPFSSDPDTLRQFETGNQVPQIRVWPVPTQSLSGTTVINSAASVSSSSGSSSTPSSGIAIKTATLNAGLIDVGSSFVGSVAMAKSFQLISVLSTEACEIRMYGSGVVQSFDLSRATDAPPQAEIIPNIITDVVFDTLPYSWQFQSIVGANQDATQTTTIYVTVINTTDSVLTNVTVSIGYVPLEA